MTIPAIDPSAVVGSEWQIPAIAPTGAPGVGELAPSGVDGVAPTQGFGSVLADQIGKLSELQNDAATASQALADGTASDLPSVVMAVEKAQLAMQLAGQIRTKGAEAINDIFHTQI